MCSGALICWFFWVRLHIAIIKLSNGMLRLCITDMTAYDILWQCNCLKLIEHPEQMVSWTHLSLRISFTRFNNISTTTRIQFKTMRLTSVLYFTNLKQRKIGKFSYIFLSHQLENYKATTTTKKLTKIFSNGIMPRGSLSVVYSK